MAGVKREIKTETTGSFAYNFSVLKKVPEEPNFSVNRTALKATNFPTKGLRSKHRNSPYIFSGSCIPINESLFNYFITRLYRHVPRKNKNSFRNLTKTFFLELHLSLKTFSFLL